MAKYLIECEGVPTPSGDIKCTITEPNREFTCYITAGAPCLTEVGAPDQMAQHKAAQAEAAVTAQPTTTAEVAATSEIDDRPKDGASLGELVKYCQAKGIKYHHLAKAKGVRKSIDEWWAAR